VNVPYGEQASLIGQVVVKGDVKYLRLLIASRQGMDISFSAQETLAYRQDDRGPFTLLEIARLHERAEMVSLLERCSLDFPRTRHEVRAELGHPSNCSAELFALVIFLCEGLFCIRAPILPLSASARFLIVAGSLPMELQMLLCHRAVGSCAPHILTEDSEPAFRSLAASLVPIKL